LWLLLIARWRRATARLRMYGASFFGKELLMPDAQAGPIRIHYRREGAGEPLLLVMGFGGSGAMWDDATVAGLARRFDVIVPDNRGTGESEKRDEPIQIATLADDLAALLDALGIARAHLFGVSMGGMIAQEFALRHPDRLRGLVLGCTNPGGSETVAAPPEVVGLLLPQKGMTPHEAVQRTFQAMLTPEFIAAQPGFLETMTARMLEHPTPRFVFARQMEAIGGYSTFARLSEIGAPTLVISGDRDRLVPPQNSRLLAERIPGARLAVIPGVAHNFFWENQPETVRLVTEFLEGIPDEV
jgi:3-oxoadipate enol-lactonase